MDQIIEKLMAEGKALVGYDQEDVKEKLLSLEANFTEKKNSLLKQLEENRVQNKELKEKIMLLKGSPLNRQLKDAISSMFMTAFLGDTQEISRLIEELDRLEQPYYEMIDIKKKQKEQAKSRVSEASEFIKTLQGEIKF